ncbi:ATP-binding protein [Trebonia sp.]|uniref:ATP-binding protein n=1 Tax=Trebonia sp. TaxID=2767075 RepID=UPI00262ACE82|nr:ATP-binding protein [Trebonia sp.]
MAASAGLARAWARAVLAAWDLGHLAGDAELAVSELVTNAVQASSSADSPDPVRLCLTSIGTQLLVQVRDGCPAFPVHTHSGVTDEAGRGLLIIDHVAIQAGCYRTPRMPGKVVWCLIAGDPVPGNRIGDQ